MDKFTLLAQETHRDIQVYRHKECGTKVAFVDIPGPNFRINIAMRTPPSNAKGVPHCLEHMCFFGTPQYTRGELDTLAVRCLSPGTNAFTASDHTCYNITLPSEEGVRRLFPVFLDHVMEPTLAASTFMTEVHHVTPKGGDSGVLYSEMQGRENGEMDVTMKALDGMVYPNSMYIHDSGGWTPEIRRLNVTEVRNFHKEYYNVDNLCIVLTGHYENKSTFLEFVDVAVQRGLGMVDPEWETTWDDEFPLPKAEKGLHTRTVFFPAHDEATSTVHIAWRLGLERDELIPRFCCDVFSDVLTAHSGSILHQVFVESDDAVCTDVSGHVNDYQEYAFTLSFEGVELETSAKSIYRRLRRTVETMVKELETGETKRGSLHDRLHVAADRLYWMLLDGIEDDPSDYYSSVVLHELLHDPKCEYTCVERYAEHCRDAVMKFTPNDWKQMLIRVFNNATKEYGVNVLHCKPSTKLSSMIDTELGERNRRMRKALGKAHRYNLKQKVKKAIHSNRVQLRPNFHQTFPALLHDDGPVGAYDHTEEVRVLKHASGDTAVIVATTPHTTFSSIRTFYDASAVVAPADVAHLILLENIFLNSPLGEQSYTDVCDDLYRTLQSYDVHVGLDSNSFDPSALETCFVMHLSAERGAEHTIVSWMKRLTSELVVTSERVLSAAKKISSSLSENLRDADFILKTMHQKLRDMCGRKFIGPQLAFSIQPTIERIVESGVTEKDLATIRRIYKDVMSLAPSAVQVMSTSSEDALRAIANLTDANIMPAGYNPQHTPKVPNHSIASKTMTPKDPVRAFSTKASNQVVVVGMKGIDSANVQVITPYFPESERERAVVYTLNSALNISEGPLSLAVREPGYAYGASISASMYFGELVLSAHDCSDVIGSLNAILNTVERFIHPKESADGVPNELKGTSLENTMCHVRWSDVTEECSVPDVFRMSLQRCVGISLPVPYYDLVKDLDAKEMLDLAGRHFDALSQMDKRVVIAVVKESALPTVTHELKTMFPGAKVHSMDYNGMMQFMADNS
eukprot:PhM_4_TR3059/c0_g1_i1/m.97749